MSWHAAPGDGAWRKVHLAYLAATDQGAWLFCTICGHEAHVAPAALAAAHGLPMSAPLLMISRRLVCTRCGGRKAHCWPRPLAAAPTSDTAERTSGERTR